MLENATDLLTRKARYAFERMWPEGIPTHACVLKACVHLPCAPKSITLTSWTHPWACMAFTLNATFELERGPKSRQVSSHPCPLVSHVFRPACLEKGRMGCPRLGIHAYVCALAPCVFKYVPSFIRMCMFAALSL